jgi:hypothetical protein
MALQDTVITKKRRGPAPTGKGRLIGVRMSREQLAALDTWIAAQPKTVSRPEAIRAMVAAALQVMGRT